MASERVVDAQVKVTVPRTRFSRQVYSRGTYRYATEFHDIARRTRISVVKAYLLGCALELYLKSFLVAKGYDVKQLKKKTLGHNISNLLTECEKNGFADHFRISDKLRADVDEFSIPYSDKDYQYFPLLHWMLHEPFVSPKERLFSFAEQLKKRLPAIIGGSPREEG
jgi:hypothetical protein